MKSFEFTSLHFSVVHLFLILSALVGLSAAQQNAWPILDKSGTFAISIEDEFVTVRNTRTGQVPSVEPVDAPAPGTPPLPATGYQFQTLTTPVGASSASAQGINSSGTQIVGGCYAPSGKNSYGLVYSGDQRKVLRYPGAAQTTLTGINNEGAIIGTYGPSGNPSRYAFVYEIGQFKPINQYGSPTAVPAGISDSRAIVGVYLLRGTITYRSVLIVNDVYTDIVFPGLLPATTKVGGINQSGEIVGWYQKGSAGSLGFTDLNGTFTTLQVPGAVSTFAYAISNSGNVAGIYYDSTSQAHGFVLINGQFKTVDYPGASQTQVLGIDDAGDVVGTYYRGPDCTLPDQNCGFLATAH